MIYSQLELYSIFCNILHKVLTLIRITGESPFNSKDYKKMLKLNKKCKISFEIESFDEISEDCIVYFCFLKVYCLPSSKIKYPFFRYFIESI